MAHVDHAKLLSKLKDPNVEMGRSWIIKENEGYVMNCFDRFGNRDNYDYHFISKLTGKVLDNLRKVPQEEAVAYWEEYYAQAGKNQQAPKQA